MAARLPVAREGLPFIAAFAAVSVLVGTLVKVPLVVACCWVLTLWCIWFFRDPERTAPEGEGLVIAPADGVVIVVEEVAAAPLSGQPARKVSIFMNVFNVHVNRLPVDGSVADLAHHPGRFFNAALDKASLENERMEVLLTTPRGERITMVQVAGLIARRIICRLQKGQSGRRGERFGLIRFGSRVDLYLPLSARVNVGLGEKTRSGETVVAML